MSKGRMLTWTETSIASLYRKNGELDLSRLISLPALFADETSHHRTPQYAHVGRIFSAVSRGNDIQIEYAFDADINAISQEQLIAMAPFLDINLQVRGINELENSHWAVKDADLFRVLLTNHRPVRRRPTAFSLPEPAVLDPTQVSAMMPFSPPFNGVYGAIKASAENAGLRCDRVDGIWENHTVIQDVIGLIDRSAFVICDCTGRNPNVFYEIGIAHSLGKEVILITQNGDDIPFDLRHIRYLTYLNNGEGLSGLQIQLTERLRNPIVR
jgi:hypothetical protein